jgi:nucleoside-diphosphate-sugar epimerase
MGNFLGAALHGESVVVHARHPVIRSYLHADDLAVWLLRLATAEGGRGEACNVGSGEAISVRDLAALVAGIAGVKVSLPDAAGDVLPPADRYVPDVGLAYREFGLRVAVPLNTAIKQTLEVLSALVPKAAVQSGQSAS